MTKSSTKAKGKNLPQAKKPTTTTKPQQQLPARTKELLIIALFLLLTLIFFRGLLTPKNAIFGSDTIGEYYPRLHFAFENLDKNKQIAQWYPNVMGGLPFYAVGFPYYYPLRAPFKVIDPDGMGAYTKLPWMIHLFLGGYLMYLLLLALGYKRSAGIFAGIAYMFTASILTIIYAGHEGKLFSYWLIPGIVAAFHLGIVRRKLHWFVIAGLGLALQLLSPHTQATFHTGIILGLYTIYHMILAYKDERKLSVSLKIGVYALIAVIVGIGIGGIQALPQIEYSTFTSRASMENAYDYATSYSFPPEETLSFLAPGIFGFRSGEGYWGGMELKLNAEYMGVWVFLLALIGIVAFWKRREVRFLAVLALFGLLVAYGKHFPLYKLLYYSIPKFKMMRAPGQFLILFAFPMCVLAGIGLESLKERWLKTKFLFTKDLAIKVVSIFTLIVTILALLATIGAFDGSITNYIQGKDITLAKAKIDFANGLWRTSIFAIFGCLLIIGYANKKLPWMLMVIIFVSVTIVDLFLVDNKFLVVMSKNYIKSRFYPSDELVEIMQKETQPYRILPLDEFSTSRYSFYNIQSAGGFSAVKTDLYGKFNDNLSFNNLAMISLWGVKYLTSQRDLTQLGLDKVGANIYQNKYVLPRVFIVDSIQVAKDDEECYKIMKDQGFMPGLVAVVDQELTAKLGPAPNSFAEIKEYTPNYIKIEANATGQCLLVLSDLYYPLWKVKVDGSDKKIIRTDFMFRGVQLDHAGKITVEFFFESPWYERAKMITLITLLIVFCYLIWFGIRWKKVNIQ
jgi:hypothetical protein